MRIVHGLPRDTHCWIVEEISGGHHAKQQIYSRYVKFVGTLATTSRACVRFLFNYVSGDVRSQVGGNLKRIFHDTGTLIIPGKTRPSALADYRVYPVPGGEEDRVPLILCMKEILADNFEIIFNEEGDDEEQMAANDIQAMLNELCSS